MTPLRSTANLVVLLIALIGIIPGCGTSALPPPLSVSYRPSLVCIGQVVVITYNSIHYLYNVKVVGRNFQQVSSVSVKATDNLTPGNSVQVGWLEFGSWVPHPGESIEIYADNYATPKVSIIPK
jgi:hypothetical protein